MRCCLMTLKDYLVGLAANRQSHAVDGSAVSFDNESAHLFSETLFAKLLTLERRRAERSRNPFALMLIDAAKSFRAENRDLVLARLLVSLSASTRETDVWGWHKQGCVIGVILTELGSADPHTLRGTMLSKLRAALMTNLEPDQMKDIRIAFHVFPEDLHLEDGDGHPDDSELVLYPDLQSQRGTQKAARAVKRCIDVCGSLAAIVLLAPVYAGIAAAVKLTSKGPVLFKQTRIGQYGRPFTFLKFRSMYFLNNPKIHQEYVKRLIAGTADNTLSGGNGGVYKLANDPRVTPLGRFLRRTSLDELPQFFNVLRGDMSLVGPRPPIPYEIEAYDIWHRRRFFEVKPGITGLWQVKGRSRVTFDEMVRLDVQYMRNWSLGLDFRILLETPWAVVFGKGAH